MPGNLVHQGAVVLCAHGGQAMPAVPNARVSVSGQATIALNGPWTITGCPFPPTSGGPCATATWSVGTARVTSSGQPLVFSTGVASCLPTGVPLTVTSVQPRAVAT